MEREDELVKAIELIEEAEAYLKEQRDMMSFDDLEDYDGFLLRIREFIDKNVRPYKHERFDCPYSKLKRHQGGKDMYFSEDQTCIECYPHRHNENCEWECERVRANDRIVEPTNQPKE